jgi:AmmeMemoRadiSam system protein A
VNETDARLLSEDEGRVLLALAREAVRACAAGQPGPDTLSCSARLRTPRAAFVTLRVGAALRGCIGVVEADRPLAETAARCAAAAASEDPRFPPLTPGEAATCTIEITVLDPPFQVDDPARIEIGRHGLIATRGGRRGVLLPQVAVEQGWDLATFLREVCRKAGLEPEAWERGATLQAFAAQRFSEEEGPTRPPPSSPPPPRPPSE